MENAGNSLFWLLLQASILVKPGVAQLSEAYGLTPGQIFTICSLELNKAAPMHTVCTVLHCDASNVTGIVDRLVTAGYVERKELPQDRRVKALTLTAKGTELRQRLLQESARMMLTNEAKLTAAEKTSLRNLLAKLLAQ